MNESSKSSALFTDAERALLRGRVLDIGAGRDPVVPHAEVFDLGQGDANHIGGYAPESFDCVYSSHCLEHMHDPPDALANWWSLVKPGGALFVIVPDEDLYEQGAFPSRYNPDHKATFTIAKKRSWSPRSHNLLDLALALPGGTVVSVRLNDIGYDRSLAATLPAGTPGPARKLCMRWLRSLSKRGLRGPRWWEIWSAHSIGVDQTQGAAAAQIELVVRRTAA